MPLWMRHALARKQPGSVVVKVPHNRPAEWVDCAKQRHIFRKSESKQQFLWKTHGCVEGAQHFKVCTPAALTDASRLLCPFCAPISGAWQAAGRAEAAAAEQQFMQLLEGMGESEEWCWQVAHPCWRGAIDFYSLRRQTFVQIDDSYHFSNACNNDAAWRDLLFNVAAYRAGLPVARVHAGDLSSPAVVMAAIEKASQRKGIVFTVKYGLRGYAHVEALCMALGMNGISACDEHLNMVVR